LNSLGSNGQKQCVIHRFLQDLFDHRFQRTKVHNETIVIKSATYRQVDMPALADDTEGRVEQGTVDLGDVPNEKGTGIGLLRGTHGFVGVGHFKSLLT
jgi:hypothetical protein